MYSSLQSRKEASRSVFIPMTSMILDGIYTSIHFFFSTHSVIMDENDENDELMRLNGKNDSIDTIIASSI
jgi:hypothetical protein